MSTVVGSTLRLVLLCAAMAPLAACRGAPPVLKIGLVAPFEGRHRAIGYDVIYSARLAVRQANEDGRLGRYRLNLTALDDGGTESGAVRAAATLAADPAIIAVVGHGLPATGAAARPIYAAAGVPFIALPSAGLVAVAPDSLPADFHAAYSDVTPFGEAAGPYAAPMYDALSLLLAALEATNSAAQAPTRATVAAALPNLSVQGITGQMVPGN